MHNAESKEARHTLFIFLEKPPEYSYITSMVWAERRQ